MNMVRLGKTLQINVLIVDGVTAGGAGPTLCVPSSLSALFLHLTVPLYHLNRIICPLSILDHWYEELTTKSRRLQVFIHYGSLKLKGTQLIFLRNNH